MINAAKTSVVMSLYSKARHVMWTMSSCKLRDTGEISLYKYVRIGEAMAVNMPCTILDFRDLPPPGFIIISVLQTSSTVGFTLHKLQLYT